MKKKIIIRSIISILIITIGIIIDQVVKKNAFLYLRPIQTYELINNIIGLRYCENTGVAFSFFSNHTEFFTIFNGIVLLLLAYVIFFNKITSGTAYYSLVVILTGGIGNLIDRIIHGFVIDMFEIQFMDFAIFNVADIFVTCGAIVFIICFIFKKGEVGNWSSKSRKTLQK